MGEKKILVVDDEKEFVEVIRVLLESHGFQVVAANSGREGVETALREMPDAIVLDVMMETDTAGFDAARKLRADERTKGIPIIMLTGVNQQFPFKFGPDEFWLPVDTFMEKPLSPERLLAEVRNATD